jgi:hypothetical protein
MKIASRCRAIHREDCRTVDERVGWPASVSVRCPFGPAFGWNVVIFPAD